MLTQEQISHFHTFGFVVLRQVFDPDEVAVIRHEADEIFAEHRDWGPVTDETQYVQPFFERKPYLSTLPEDDRVYGIGVDLVGPDFILAQTEGRARAGDTPWHGAPGPDDEPMTVKINFYLDDLTKETGALRFVPGSHIAEDPDRYAILRENNADPDFRPFGMAPSDIPCYAAETNPGDLVVFTESLLHASFGGSPGRHQNAINFMENPKTDGQVAHVRGLYERWTYGLRPAQSYVDSESPRIRRMVSRLVDWGFDTWPV